MPISTHAVPLSIEYLQPPAAPLLPATAAVDFTALLRAAGKPGLVDLSSLTFEADGRRVPVQFSPAVDFEAVQRCWGTLHLLPRAPGSGRLRGTLRFVATDDLKAARVPYTPRSYRQVLPDGRATPVPYFPRMQLVPQPEGRLDIEDDGKLVTSYHYRRGEPKPYLFPLIGPAGRGLTRLGHPHDPGDTHSHHHSVWCGYHGVNGESFWEEKQGGLLQHLGFDRQEDGPVYARFLARIDWVSRSGKPVLKERRDVTVYAGDGSRILDFALHYAPPAGGPASLDKTSFGFLAVRVAKSMGVFDGGGLIRNSEGGINEPGIFWKPARWCDYSGPVTASAWNGIGFLDHPSNPRHPTPWHVRPDGWMGAAFGTDAPHEIPAGGALDLRYRLFLHAGDWQEGKVEAAWHDFAHPPRVTLGAAV